MKLGEPHGKGWLPLDRPTPPRLLTVLGSGDCWLAMGPQASTLGHQVRGGAAGADDQP